MANINDALGAFALGTLSKAAGQDFLSPMLQQTRDKDMFLFQQKQAEAAIARERKNRKEESAKSKQGLLNALKQAGAITDEDIVGAGGAEILSSMEDSEFTIAMANFGDKRARAMSDSDLFATVRGMAAASNIAIPEGGLTTREQALELKAKIDYQRLLAEQNKQTSKETRAETDRAISAIAEDFSSVDPLAVTPEDIEGKKGLLTGAAAKVKDNAGDLGDEAPTFLQRIRSMGNVLNSLATHARANEVDAALQRDPSLFFQEYQNFDLPLQRALDGRPQVPVIRKQTSDNYEALRGLPEEGLPDEIKGAWQAAHGNNTVEELMRKPDEAMAVYGARVEDARRLMKDKEKEKTANDQAASTKAVLDSEYIKLGLTPPEISPTTFIKRTNSLDGPVYTFDQAGYTAAVAEDMSRRELTGEQALSLVKAEGVPVELRNAAGPVVMKLLQSDEAAEKLTKAQETVDQRFIEATRLFGDFLAKAETIDTGALNEAKRWTMFRKWMPGLQESDPARMELQVLTPLFSGAEHLWNLRDFRSEASALVEQARVESRQYAGIKPVEDALQANLEVAEKAALDENGRAALRSVFLRAGNLAMSGEGDSVLDGSKEGSLAFLDIPEDVTSASDFVRNIAQGVKGKESNLADVSMGLLNLLKEDSAAFPNILADELASWAEIARAIDNGLADESHRDAIYRAVKKARHAPDWLDSPDKLPIYILLISAERAENPL